jgi:hypothetical protein
VAPAESSERATGESDPRQAVSQGLRLYGNDEFDKARDKFAEASSELSPNDAEAAAIAAFDEACACHRQGEFERARERYLQAGLSHDRRLAAAAHYNLGTLAAEAAHKLAGEDPETVAVDKRPEVLDQLRSAVASFRHSLELQGDNPRARRDIELIRQWIRYYSERWRERDRQKRREESNLVAFLELLIEIQWSLRESVKLLSSPAPADAYAELKRAQLELQEEIEPLHDKIRSELQATGDPNAGAPPDEERERGIALLESWADEAGSKMSSAANRLGERQSEPAADEQQSAIDELEKIWEAVIAFHPLLARDLADQTLITRSLEPPGSPEPSSETDDKASPEKESSPTETPPREDENEDRTISTEALDSDDARNKDKPPGATLVDNGEHRERLAEVQERTLRRTQLLELKAKAELERLDQAPPTEAGDDQGSDDKNDEDDNPAGHPPQVDPEAIKQGYRKAIELVPQAVEEMQTALKSLRQNDGLSAYPPAEEARKILEEIQKAQPKNQPPQDSNKQDQDKKDQNQENDKQENKDESDQKEPDQQENDKQNDQPNKDEQKKDKPEKPGDDDQRQKKDEPKAERKPVSQDRIEEALRQVRERQQEKRERDRKMKARILSRIPVEKDW